MTDEKNCCGHGGKSEAEKAEWKEKYEKMSDAEKKEMLEKKQAHVEKKLAWIKEELGKLSM